MEELRIDGRALAVVRGDITRIAADAIVNAANSALAGGGGVDGAIHRAGGPGIMAELGERYGANRHCPPGSAVVTGAGALPARWVIHAVGPIWRGGGLGEASLLASAYAASCAIASDLGARTITFPAISAGAYGYPVEEAARIGLAEVRDHLAGPTRLERATFVLFSTDMLEIFAEALRELGREGRPAGRDGAG